MTMGPDVTVIVPIRNRAHWLERSLGSVLSQTLENIEILVIDDASEDDLDVVLNRLADPRVQRIRLDSHSGVSVARNTGIRLARAPLIAFLDSDDAWKPDKLTTQLNFMKQHPELLLVHTEEIWIRRGKRVNPCRHHQKSGGHIFGPSLRRCLISPSAVLLRREAFERYGLFEPTLPVCEDYDLWLRITSREAVGFVDIPLVIKYGGHDDQLSTAYTAMDQFRIQSMQRLLDTVPLSIPDRRQVLEVICEKATILLQGALKRQLPEATLYREWRDEAVDRIQAL